MTYAALLLESWSVLLESWSVLLETRTTTTLPALLNINNLWTIVVEASGRLIDDASGWLLNNNLAYNLLARLWTRLHELANNDSLSSWSFFDDAGTLTDALIVSLNRFKMTC